MLLRPYNKQPKLETFFSDFPLTAPDQKIASFLLRIYKEEKINLCLAVERGYVTQEQLTTFLASS